MSSAQDTFWEQYGHFVGCTVRESNSAVGIVTGVTNDGEPMLHIRRRNGKIDKRKPSEVHKTCACGKRALDSNGKVCPGHENCRPLACAPPEPEECPGPHDDGPLNYCPTCSWSRKPSATVATKYEAQADLIRWTCGHLGVAPNESAVLEILEDFDRAKPCDACHNKQCTCADPYAVRTAEGWTNRV